MKYIYDKNLWIFRLKNQNNELSDFNQTSCVYIKIFPIKNFLYSHI